MSSDADSLIPQLIMLKAGSAKKTDDVDKVLSVLSQVTLAVLIIFVMTSIIFSNKYKNHAEYWKYRSEEFSRTPKGEIVVDLQRQKLLLAIEQTENYYKEELGHFTFLSRKNGFLSVVIETVLNEKTVTDRFRSACNYAKVELSHQSTFYNNFIKQVLNRAELSKHHIEVTVENLDIENRKWFSNRVRQVTSELYNSTVTLQRQAKEAIAAYFGSHFEEIETLRQMAIDTYSGKNSMLSSDQIKSFEQQVKEYVKQELVNQNIRFLEC